MPPAASAGWGGAWLRLGRLLQHRDLALEVGDVLEALVHGREPQVRDRVERLQTLEDRQADALARDLRARGPHLLLDLGRQRRHRPVGDRTTGHRALDAGLELVARKRLLGARSLDDDQGQLLETFVGREATTARDALAPSPDGRSVVRRPRVDDLVLGRLAVGTTHRATVPGGPIAHDGACPPASTRADDDLARDEWAVTACGRELVDDRARVAAGLES